MVMNTLRENLMMMEAEKATAYAGAGVDILSLGDDIGTQNSIMMDVALWERWLKPRLDRVIRTARSINPHTLYRSAHRNGCGYSESHSTRMHEL